MKLNLNLSKDGHGITRSYGRLKNAKILFDTKAPIFINKKHKLADLIVYYSNLKVKQTLTELRSNYWKTRGRSYVKKLLRPYALCKRLNARPYRDPEHSDLPPFDYQFSFSSTGVDYLGTPKIMTDENYDRRKL